LALQSQQTITLAKSDKIDSINLRVTHEIVKLLEERITIKATLYLRLKSSIDQKSLIKKLERVSKDIQPIKAKTRILVQNSYKNYLDSFNICQVVYYNDEGRFYLFELFFLKGDVSSKIVDIFIKDLLVLKKERDLLREFRRKNPNTSQPPLQLPPGIYVKEKNL
jgi:hypothetical protein